MATKQPKEKETKINVNAIKIEKNIPIPRGSTGMYGDLINKMEVGDSCVIDDPSSVAGIASAMKKMGFKLLSRSQSDGRVRIWKTERPKKAALSVDSDDTTDSDSE